MIFNAATVRRARADRLPGAYSRPATVKCVVVAVVIGIGLLLLPIRDANISTANIQTPAQRCGRSEAGRCENYISDISRSLVRTARGSGSNLPEQNPTARIVKKLRTRGNYARHRSCFGDVPRPEMKRAVGEFFFFKNRRWKRSPAEYEWSKDEGMLEVADRG